MASQKERRVAPSTAAPRNVTPSTAAPRNATPSAAEPRDTANVKIALSNEEMYRLIAETAYFKAKARGFEPGGEVQDWIEAEAEVRQRMERGAAR
jgi:hypothetical protein